MSREITAEINDKATFYFSSGSKIFGDILHMPAATGDSWIVQTYYQGEKDLVAYIQSFDYMYLEKRKEP